jgi:hypothetical protein
VAAVTSTSAGAATSDKRRQDFFEGTMKLDLVRKHALSLPEVTEEPHHEYSSFRVRGKIFVTVPPTEDVIHVFVEEDDRDRALAMYPEWTQKLMWGSKARGLRVFLDAASPSAVKALVSKAYEAKARAAR